VFLGGGMADASGAGFPGGGVEGFFGVQQPPDVYTLHVFVDTDEDGMPDPNGVQASATITVPCCTIAGLAGLVVGLHLQAGIRTSLNAKLREAQAAADNDNLRGACQIVDAFVAEVRAQSGNKISGQAQDLISTAERLKGCLGCR
jgi:hypothetical protein